MEQIIMINIYKTTPLLRMNNARPRPFWSVLILAISVILQTYSTGQAQFGGGGSSADPYIDGPAIVDNGTTHMYYFIGASSQSNHQWTVYGGQKVSEYQGWVQVKWTSAGTNRYVQCTANTSAGTQTAKLYVKVEAVPPPGTPGTPVLYSNNCDGTYTIKRGSPPSGVTWYWQGKSSSGTSKSSSALYYSATSSGYYYLRAYSTSSGLWSTSSSRVYVTTSTKPATPGIPSMTENCGDTRVYKPANTSSISYYWTSGTTTSGAANDSYKDLTQPGTLYLRARGSTGCWSDVTTVNVNVNTIPDGPTTAHDELRYGPGTVTLRVSGGSGSGYRWYDSEDNIIAGANTATYSPFITTTSTFRVSTVSAAGCESENSVPVTASMAPTIDVSGSLSLYAGENVTLTALEGFDTYQWYRGGVQIPYTSQHITTSIPGVYEVRATSAGRELSSTPVTVTVISDDMLASSGYNSHAITRVLKPGVARADLSTLNNADKRSSITYKDGFGRPLQEVALQASPQGQDVVHAAAYDRFGRPVAAYMPYVSNLADGSYHKEALTAEGGYQASEQYQFYQNTPAVAHDNDPYATSVYEASPLHTIREAGSAGSLWQPGGHTTRYDWKNNVAGVRKWELDAQGKPVSTSEYPASQVSMSEVVDSQGAKAQTFVDKRGRVLLEKSIAPTGETLSKYYVYDLFDRLVYIIPPLALEQANYQPDETFIQKYLYKYTYDKYGRIIESQAPGIAPVYQVYDRRNRVVLSQNGNQRARSAGEWSFVKYDRYNRTILTGITELSADVAAIRLAVHNSSVYHEDRGNAVHGYTNNAYPQEADENNYLSIVYYDDYNFAHASAYPMQQALGHQNAHDHVKGAVTGSKVKVLGQDNAWLHAVVYYDDRGRAIQNLNDHHLGGTDVTTVKYDFEGKALEVETSHQSISQHYTYNYDHQGRLLEVVHNIDNGPDVILTRNEFNALGQLIDKKLHAEDGLNFAQSIDYRYNIKGWLTSINNPTLTISADNDENTDYFGMAFEYNALDGKINSLTWSSGQAGNVKQKGYDYTYDNFGRLQAAGYFEVTQAGKSLMDAYSVNGLQYDAGGNIKSLNRKGAQGENMDELSYVYDGHQLMSISDNGATGKAGFDDGHMTGNDYIYDQDGNMTRDLNNEISQITYNTLNLPDTITRQDGSRIRYIYTGAGEKLAEEIYDDANTLLKRTDYAGGYIYENDLLQYIMHAEGRIVPTTDGSYEYQYFIGDHQGNTRTAFTTKPKEIVFTLNYENNESMPDDADLFEAVTTHENNLMDHTDAGTTAKHSQLLRGSEGERVGSVIAIPVGAGDKVTAKAFAKYVEVTETLSGATTSIASTLVGAFTGSTGVAETGSQSIHNSFGEGSLIGSAGFPYEDQNAPYAFLNVMFLPEGEVISLEHGTTFAYDQLSAGFTQPVGDGVNRPFDELKVEGFEAPANGYVMVYVSNENPYLVDVHFDDLSITVNEHPVIAVTDYYPFGLQHASSWTRVTSLKNKYLYNSGSELDENTGQYMTPFRRYDPATGRFTGADALTHQMSGVTPYQYAFNNPISFNDPMGLAPEDQQFGLPVYQDASTGGSGRSGSSTNWFRGRMAPGSGNHWTDQYRS
ncbi:hypothetical protein E1163_27570, partial [Fulvivirga kasyanovii]|nr:hypothetical protein [Fulvivirga kasyanovii]